MVRWGIPGWIFLFILMAYFSIVDYSAVKSIILNEKAPIVVATISLFLTAGVILGHMIHQISICFGFVLWTNWKKFFKGEYELDQKIINSDKDKGKEIQRIYSYRLGNVHALRALWFSLLLALLTVAILSIFWEFSFYVGVLIGIVLLLDIIVFLNWRYFQANLNNFIKNVKKEF